VAGEDPADVFTLGGGGILTLADARILGRGRELVGERRVEVHPVAAPRQCAGIDHRPRRLSGRGVGF
jgi:hypothetical protein